MLVDTKRTSKFADQTLARAQIADDSAACDTLEDVFAIPRNEVAVVDDILLVLPKLSEVLARGHET